MCTNDHGSVERRRQRSLEGPKLPVQPESNFERIREPELMTEADQVRAYSEADFAVPHDEFVLLAGRKLGPAVAGRVLDLGCGPADVTVRFARSFPDTEILGVDGAAEMIALGRKRIAENPDLAERVALLQGVLPGAAIPLQDYSIVISNSLLHHLHNPTVLWDALHTYGSAGTKVFIMDLMRPRSIQQAAALRECYAGGEPPVLQRDFYNSLLAAFTPAEVQQQLELAGLGGLKVEVVSDRHLIVYGELGPS